MKELVEENGEENVSVQDGQPRGKNKKFAMLNLNYLPSHCHILYMF